MTNVLWKTMWQYRGAQHARLKGRRGPRKPTIEVGHSILVAAYHMPNRNEALIDRLPNAKLRREGYRCDERRDRAG